LRVPVAEQDRISAGRGVRDLPRLACAVSFIGLLHNDRLTDDRRLV
jgi:hypothetical protein